MSKLMKLPFLLALLRLLAAALTALFAALKLRLLALLSLCACLLTFLAGRFLERRDMATPRGARWSRLANHACVLMLLACICVKGVSML